MSRDPVTDAVFESWNISVIRTAARLGIFARLDAAPCSAQALAAELRCAPLMVEALLDACVGIGVLQRRGHEYVLGQTSGAHLVPGRPLYLGHIIEVQARAAASWDRLIDLVRTGSAPALDDELHEVDRTFTMAMNDLGANGEAAALAQAVDLSQCRSLLDVGCGSGLYAIELCRRFPMLRATLVDREPVLRTAAAMVDASGLGARVTLVAGDMTQSPLPSGADAVLLSDSLYGDEAEVIAVLRQARAAIAGDGVVVVRGYYPDPGGSESAFGAVFRLNLLLSNPARVPPTAADIVRALEAADFCRVRRFPLTPRSTCFVASARA